MDQIPRNARLFVWFRVLFNCRFYYPVLAVFFIDLGLPASQYILLNVVWAITIVVLEVPSGALADLVGRKRLVVGAAGIMVFEMALLVAAPVGGSWLFGICILNRILAGIAEAAASGADEALAYDSLEGEEKDTVWDDVLSKVGRRMAVCMAVATLIGAAVYDQSVVNRFSSLVGAPYIPSIWVIKIPVIFCLIQGIGALCIAMKMEDIGFDKEAQRPKLRELMGQTLKASSWLISHKVTLILILGGLCIDSFTRNFATLTSRFYRLLDFPEFSFGLCGFLVSLAGFLVPYLAKVSVRRYSLKQNVIFAFLFTFVGMMGLAFVRGPWGVMSVVISMMALGYSSFIVSKFLNQMAPSKDRATILSVKGLMFNLGYAGFSLIYAYGLKYEREAVERRGLLRSDDLAFESLLRVTPLVFLIVMGVYVLFAKRLVGASRKDMSH